MMIERGGLIAPVTAARVLVVLVLGAAGAAAATPQPVTSHGNALLTGGIGEDEREAMRQEVAPFNLWLMFVEEGSGHYVAGVKVTVADANDSPVVDVVSDGPWLFARVPPGRYQVRMPDGRVQPLTVGAEGRTVSILRVAPEPAELP